MAGRNRVEAVEKALAILDAFTEDERTLSLAELSVRLGLYKSTILRLIGSLEHFGYIERMASGRYRLGASVWRLGSLYRSGHDLGEFIRPELRRLVEATGETAAFFVRAGDRRMCLYRLNSPRAVRHHLDEGVLLPLERGASGRVILAYAGQRGEPYDTVRRNGYCVSLGERDPDVAAAARPVFGRERELRGVLAVSALATRMTGSTIPLVLDALKDSAERLGRALQENAAGIPAEAGFGDDGSG